VPSINALLSNPEYSKLSDEDKAHARLGWFDANVASSPNFQALSEEDRIDAMNGFEDMVRGFKPAPESKPPVATQNNELSAASLENYSGIMPEDMDTVNKGYKDIGNSLTTEPAKDFLNTAIAGAETRQAGKYVFADPNEEGAFKRTIATQEQMRGKPLEQTEIDEIAKQYMSVPQEAAKKQLVGWEKTLKGAEAALPDIEERERSKALQAMMGMARFAPSMGVTAFSGPAGFATTFSQLYGSKYGEYRKNKVDPETANEAAFVAAALSAPVEQAGNILQIKMLGPMAKSMGLTPKAAGRAIDFLTKARKTTTGNVVAAGGRIATGGASEGGEEWTQAYSEAAGDVIAQNPNADADTLLGAYKQLISSPKFKAERNQSTELGAIGGVMLGGAGAGIQTLADGSRSSGFVKQPEQTVQPETKSRFTTDLESGKTTVEKLQAIRAKMPPDKQADIDAAIAAYKPKEAPFSFPAQTPEDVAAVGAEFEASQQDAEERAKRYAMDAVLAQSAERRRENQEILDAKNRVGELQQRQQAAIDQTTNDTDIAANNEIVRNNLVRQQMAEEARQKREAVPEPKAEPPIAMYRKEAAEIESILPAVENGMARVWRGNRPGEIGANPSFTSDLAGIAIPFKNAYNGELSYVDIPIKDLKQYEQKAGSAPGVEFILPKDLANKAKPVRGTATVAPPATPPSVAEAAPIPETVPIPVQETAPVQENGTAGKTEQTIPQFKTTNEAVAFGEQATPGQVAELERLRSETVAKEAEYKAAKDFSVDRTNNAFAGQLYREALEASRGEHPLQRDKRTPDQMLEDGKSKGVDIAQQYDNKLGELSTLKQQARDAGGTEADIRAAEDSGRRSGTPEAPATGGVQAEAESGGKGKSYSPKQGKRFLIVSRQYGGNRLWEIEQSTDDIVGWHSNNPLFLGKIYDTESKQWVKVGKKGTIKDKNNREVYKEVPNLNSIADQDVYGKTLSEYKEEVTKGENDEWDSWFANNHSTNVKNAFYTGKDVRPEVLKDYPELTKDSGESKPSKQSTLSKELQAAKDRLTNNTGSSQIATDILNYGIELKNKGIQKYSDFLKKMKSKFADVWDKIKGAMKALWDSMPDIRNERGEIRIGMDDEFDQEAYDFVAEYYGKEEADKQFKITKAKPKAETKSESEDDVFARNRAINVRSKSRAFTDLREVISEIAEGADKLLGSVSTRLGNISQELKAKVRKLDFDIGTKSKNDLVKLKPLLDKAKQRMSRRDYADWDFARKNSYKDKIEELIEKYDLGNEYKEYREVLDRLYNEAEDVGLDIGYIQDYAPRVLKNKKGFLKEVYKSKDWDIYSRALKQRAAERGITVSQMSDDQKADIISNMVAGGFSGIGGVGPTKARKIKEIPPEWNRFYMDSDAALVAYIHSMRKNIEARQFFGKVPEKVSDAKRRLALAETKLQQATDSKRAAELRDDIKEYKEIIENYKYQRDYTQNIGTYIMELMDAGVIEGSDEATVNEILNARFHERGTQGGWQTYKNIEYIDTMGSISSALTQIGDFAWAAYEGGMIKTAKNFGKALTGKSKITKEDIGMDRIAQEFADASTVSKAVNFVFKWTGLTKMDSLAKETLIANSLEKYQKRAKNNDAKLRDELSPIFGKETNSVIKELQDGAVSDNIKLLVYSRVLDFQPMALSEMPQKYLTAGNGRVFYMLKTYTLKQWDVYRNEVYNKLKNGDRSEKIQAIQNLAKLAMLLALANGGANELKDFILRRKTSFKDQVFDTLWRLAGASRFITWQVRREGFGTALAKQILPPFKFIDSLSKDLLSKEVGVPKTLESLTFIGKIMYWHMKADEEE